MKGQKRDESKLVTKFVGIILTIFSYKNLSQIPCKIFTPQCFLTNHLKHKTVNKTTCRTPSANPRQLRALVEELSNCYENFSRFSGSPDLFGKVFLITFKFS